MKPNDRNSIFREFIGTVKYAGWIALLILAIIAVLLLCGK